MTNQHFEDPGSSDQSWRVKNMSHFWEYQLMARQQQEMEHRVQEDRFKSMPDLSNNSSSCDMTSESDIDDVDGLNIVPVKDRRKVFEEVTGPQINCFAAFKPYKNWPSMPSLTVRVKPDKPQPMPLVGANTPRRRQNSKDGLLGEIHHTPVKDILAQFATSFCKSSKVSEPQKVAQPKSGKEEVDSNATNDEIKVVNFEAVAPYHWDDESNGEIYADTPINPCEEMKGVPLYVMENGLEFPLEPIKQRKSKFEKFVTPKPEPRNNSPMSTESTPERESPDPPQPELERGSESGHRPWCAILSDLTQVPSSSEPIKSDSSPYILQEEEVLKSINVVGMYRSKFS